MQSRSDHMYSLFCPFTSLGFGVLLAIALTFLSPLILGQVGMASPFLVSSSTERWKGVRTTCHVDASGRNPGILKIVLTT